jgi:protein O-GlcNAc transferase
MANNPQSILNQTAPGSAIHTQAMFQQAWAYYQKGELASAEALCRNLLSTQPRHFDCLQLFGFLAFQTNRHQMAIELLCRAIDINPQVAPLYLNIGLVFQALQRFDEALASFDKAIALQPHFAGAHFNRGNALSDLKRFNEAIASFDRAIALQPNYAEAHHGRASALNDLKHLDEALVSYNKAIALKPDFALAYVYRGLALSDLKKWSDAIASFAKAHTLDPDYQFLLGTLLHTKMIVCDWENLEKNLKKCAADIQSSKKATLPFQFLSLLDSPELHKQASRIATDTLFPKKEQLGAIEKRAKREKIRIGYYSADFHNHATTYLMAELFESHDKTRFELFGFSFGPSTLDEMRKRVSSAFDHFFDVSNRSDLDIARHSRELGIDIAIDLKGLTADSRMGIFAERCAPIQVSYIGYPGTMGADYIDYIIADTTVIPRERQSDYTEKVVYLPHSYQVNDSSRKISERVFTRQQLGLPESGFVFCCFNNTYKILPSTFDVWMRILNAVDGSVLWLLEDNPTAAKNLRKEAESRGIDKHRLIFAPRMPVDQHLARQRLADLFIDTLPYNAHTTASDALWAGLPVLTCMGKSFASRVAASLLNAIELPEMITSTETEYEAKAIELASNPEKLLNIKLKLEKKRLTTPLFDAKLFTKHLESAYTAMYEKYQAGFAPESIEV